MTRIRFAALAALVTIAPRLTAQIVVEDPDIDSNDAAAALAITTTPVGGLPSVVPAQAASAGRHGVSFRGQFGFLDADGISQRIYGLGAEIPFARHALGLTVGLLDYACDDPGDIGFGSVELDCQSMWMAGASWTTPLLVTPVGQQDVGGAIFNLAIDASVGYSSGDVARGSFSFPPDPTVEFSASLKSFAASLGVPVMLAARSGGITIIPHLTPRFAFGRASIEATATNTVPSRTSDTESGSRFMLGGGAVLFFESTGIGVTVGFQKVFVEDGDTLFGAGLSFTPR